MTPLTLYGFVVERIRTNKIALIKYEELKPTDCDDSTVMTLCGKRVKIKKLKYTSKCDDNDIKGFESSSNDPLDWNKKLDLIRQVVNGLKYLHDVSVVHTELHPCNIFVHDGVPKLANIGMSKIRTHCNLSFTQYTPPEVLQKKDILNNIKLNIYSLGVLIWEICNDGVEPFRENYNISLAIEIINGVRESPKNGTPYEFIHLYEKCWDRNPNIRPNCSEILKELEIIAKHEKVNGYDGHETTRFESIIDHNNCEQDIKGLEREKMLQVGVIEGLDLNKGRNLVENDFILGTKTILSDLGDLDISILKDKDPDIFIFNDIAKLYVPTALVQYNVDDGDVNEQFILDVKDSLDSSDDNVKKERLNKALNQWGRFVISEVIMGGAIMIKNWSKISDINKSRLMAYIQWGIDYSKGEKSPIFTNVSLNDFSQLETSKKVLKTAGDLYDWLKNIYDCQNLEIISYEKFIPSYHLLPNNLIRQCSAIEPTNGPSLRIIPQISQTQYEQKKFSEWIKLQTNSLLHNWVHELSLEHGILLKYPHLVHSENVCLKFSKEPTVTTMEKVIVLLAQPRTRQEAYLLINGIKESVNLKFENIPFLDYNSVHSKEPSKKIYCQIIVKLARISFKSANIEPIEQISDMVDLSLKSYEPYKNLGELFSNNYGHLVPKTIVLGGKLSIEYDITENTVETLRYEFDSFDASKIRNILSKWDEKHKHVNTKFLMSHEEIINRDHIESWWKNLTDNPKNWTIVSYEDWIPMYKILKQTQSDNIEEILCNNYRIVFSGKESIQRNDQISVNIKFPGSIDDNYQIYGSAAKKNLYGNWENISDVAVRFNYANEHGCVATLHKSREIRLNCNTLKIFWFVVSKQRGYYTSEYRNIQIAYGKQNINNFQTEISLKCNNLSMECILVTSFISQSLKDTSLYKTHLKSWTTKEVDLGIIKNQNNARTWKASDLYPQGIMIQWCIIYTNRDKLVDSNELFPWNVFGIALDEELKID
ncbi:25047_t:CDS:2 [Cetraspora pellucida]|uniref:25047_t:CDS:1 n=1 Tax=Cetraspora pellucida TaxID=1433469 RepID=A0A9N9FVT6_9GLOM|nr:25047_t:CDS:2 [Cetraspora pellucida]